MTQVSGDSSFSVSSNQVAASSDSGEIHDAWKFGSSNVRYASDGSVEYADSNEIIDQTSANPAAMVKVLSTGADLLRFNANGLYQESVDEIAAVYNDPTKTSEEKADRVNDLTVKLQDTIREDIKKGVFTIDVFTGEIFFHGKNLEKTLPEKLPAHEVGWELTAAFIEDLSRRKDELTTVQGYITELLSPDLVENGRLSINHSILEKKTVMVNWEPRFGTWDQSLDEYEEHKNHQSPIFKLVSDPSKHESSLGKAVNGANFEARFPGLEVPVAEPLKVIEAIRERYLALMSDTDAPTNDWHTGPEDFSDPIIVSSNKHEPQNVTYNVPGPIGDRNALQYTVVEMITKNETYVAKETLETKLDRMNTHYATINSATDQLAVNFRADNGRYNNILAAMDSYNKTVVQSLKAFVTYS